ncbi:interleukin-18-like [Acipenser oxyrinchus oxyrinchus]|uniref:Interleukin-18-like n=1 Tax=Acipenser oxyrinchus oxyrinchus TaxID=40147 RepID=A0AAD8CM89_ACIOX|nr:interleukin-18-like [Acipenser oxyrinchus oxyrinchus]
MDPFGLPEEHCIEVIDFLDGEELYFQDEGKCGDYEADALEQCRQGLSRMIRNNKGQYLVASKDLILKFEDQTRRQLDCDNVLFMIKLYKNTEGGSFPVAIQIKSGAKLKSLKCEEKENKRKVLLVEGEAPGYIENNCHAMVFYMKVVEDIHDRYTFQSALWSGWYLAFEPEDSQYKLVLKNMEDEVDGHVDENVHFELEPQQK